MTTNGKLGIGAAVLVALYVWRRPAAAVVYPDLIDDRHFEPGDLGGTGGAAPPPPPRQVAGADLAAVADYVPVHHNGDLSDDGQLVRRGTPAFSVGAGQPSSLGDAIVQLQFPDGTASVDHVDAAGNLYPPAATPLQAGMVYYSLARYWAAPAAAA